MPMSFRAAHGGVARGPRDPSGSMFWITLLAFQLPPGHILCGREGERLSREMARTTLAPGEGPESRRAGKYEDLVAPPWVVATCTSFWSGERSPPLSVEKKTDTDLR